MVCCGLILIINEMDVIAFFGDVFTRSPAHTMNHPHSWWALTLAYSIVRHSSYTAAFAHAVGYVSNR